MGKIFFKVFLCMVMIITVLTGCSGEKEENIEVINDSNSEEAEVETEQENTLEGSHVFIFKSMGNSFGDLMYEGFAEYLAGKGERVTHLGATAGAATYAAVYEDFSGEAGTSFTMDAFGNYEEVSYTVTQNETGTVITAGVPYVFYKGNITEWIDVL